MTETSDAELLAAWVTQRREPAFHALDSLSEKDREAILLRFYRSLSVKELAATLGIATDTAQKRLDRATERLREKLKRRGVTTAGSLSAVMLAGFSTDAQAAPFSTSLLSSKAIAASAVSSSIATIAFLIMTKKTTIAAVALLMLAGGAAVAIKQPTLFSKLASTPQEKRPTRSETASTTSGSTPRNGGKRADVSSADAELIAKYGESRTKLARYTLSSLLEVNELTISLLEKYHAALSPEELKERVFSESATSTAEALNLTPPQRDELVRLSMESYFRVMSELPKKVAFVRANAPAASELLLTGDAVLKGKTPAEDYHLLRDSSLPLVKLMHDLLSTEMSSDPNSTEIPDPTFIEEFRKVLDPRQAELFDQKVASDRTEHNAAILTVSRFDLEQIDQTSQEAKKVLLPLIETLQALKQLQGSSGNGKK